jgi:hypothetical protein
MLNHLRTRSVRVLERMAITAGRLADEIQVLVGLALIAAGCWMAWRPGAFLIPGAVLVWMAMPSRSAFIERPAPTPKQRRTP